MERSPRALGCALRGFAGAALLALAACGPGHFVVGWRSETYRCPEGARPRHAALAPGLQVWCALPDGTRHGPWTVWTRFGGKLMVHNFAQGVKEGPAATWHRNGRPRSTGQYRQGQRAGRWIFWTRSGRLAREVVYQGGRRVAEHRF